MAGCCGSKSTKPFRLVADGKSRIDERGSVLVNVYELIAELDRIRTLIGEADRKGQLGKVTIGTEKNMQTMREVCRAIKQSRDALVLAAILTSWADRIESIKASPNLTK